MEFFDYLLLAISWILFLCYARASIKREKELSVALENTTALLTGIKSMYQKNIEETSDMTEELIKKEEQLKILDEQFEHVKEQAQKMNEQLVEIKTKHSSDIKTAEKKAREDALKRSRSVIRGQASEHLAPFIISGTNAKDYRFLGNPVDYICFDGLSEVLDGTSNEIKEVKFIDIKTGKSSLNKSQRRIRDAIKENKVTFEVINLDKLLEERNENATVKGTGRSTDDS